MAASPPVVVKQGSHSHQLAFGACRIHPAGEYAGNVELEIVGDPAAIAAAVEMLEIRQPDSGERETCTATGDLERGGLILFQSDAVVDGATPPGHLDFHWDGAHVARVETTLAGEIVPLSASHAPVDPHLLLGAQRPRPGFLMRRRLRRTLERLPPEARSGADHVRLCKREHARSLGSDLHEPYDEWIIALEGALGFAAEDGRVPMRSDARILARYASERKARLFAAEVALAVGLPVLDARDW